ncbi:protein cordon-bleu isoform X9 [Linepithema humile]|uniref:protein cordon-bleu isoform X9 n=1 Tax=Linepithema humile TaxID=83485 RepID=UPI00351F3841
MLCLKKRRTYSFTQGACAALPRRSKKDNNHYEGSLNMAITTLPRNNRSREEKSSRMVLTVTENTPADMLAGSMELLVQLPHDHYLRTQRVTVLRSTPMMDLLVQIATAHKLTASNYTLQAIGEHGLVLSHHPNTPIGALDALQVKLLSKQGMCVPRKVKQANQPFETTFRLQVHLPRNQLYVSRVSPKMNLGEILDEVCREKNLDSSKYELRHPATLEETLDLSLSLQDYQLQEVTLYAKQRSLGQTLSTQDILALQRQEERRRQQSKQSVFGFAFKKSKESSLSMDSLGGRSVSPARSDETTRSASPLQPPTRPQRKRRPAPKPPADIASTVRDASGNIGGKDKMVINHSRNSSDSSGYHEASVLSDNPDSTARLPETLPRRSRMPGMSDTARRLAQTSQSSKSLGNLAVPGETLNRGISSTCLSSTGLRKKRAAPPPPASRPLSSAISTQALERIVDSEESLTSDIDPSKPPSDIGAPSKASSDIDCSKINSDISAQSTGLLSHKPKPETVMCESDSNIQQNCAIEMNVEARSKSNPVDCKLAKVDAEKIAPVEVALKVEQARVAAKRANQDNPSEIENLLQKVSNTLSNVLPISSSPVSEPSLPLKMNHTTASVQTNNAVVLDDSVTKLVLVGMKSNELCMDFPMGNTLNASMPNVTGMDSQQDTLDNVSAMNDNLSISDWEYQLPAPPSAFRDSISLVSDDYDTVMLGSVQDFKKLPANTVSDQVDARDNSDMNIESMKNLLNNIDENFDQKISSGKMSSVSEVEIDIKRIESEPVVKQTSAVSHKSANLRKEIISELENKLETGALVQTISKDFDRRNIDSLSAPQIAPVDNTLSNFTITTYTKPTKLDIFEEFKNPNDYATNSEKRFIKTFATLSRNKTSAPNNCDKKTTSKFEKSDANNIDCKTEPKIHSQDEPSHRWRSLIAANEKNNIQRSKSYISTFSNAKNQMEVQEIGEKKHEPRIESETTNVKKATSITDLNVNVRTSKDKFSQWRDNALKYQEEPTKEKQLQSLQVLKSILPQLKNAQQAEKNVSKEDKNTLSIKKIRYETGSNEHSMKTNVVSTRGSREFEPECKQLSKKEDTKRYVYTGPPAISLGSWSERPSVNVQIKMDIDYKLGKSNTNSNKTVNINMKNKKDATNFTDNICKNIIDQHETKNDFSTNKNPEELTRKLIAHTTASGFKIPLSSRINVSDSKTNEGNPIVMGMELKKTFIEMPKEMPRNNENEVDTTPLNFKELTKACSQHASFKQNPKCDNINKHSADYCSAQMKKIEEITDSNVKQYNDIKLPQASNQSDFSFKNQLSLHDIVQSSRAKKFTSIVGINGTSQNLELQSEMSLRGNANNTLKINPPMPVVKGFKISTTNYNTTNNRENHNGLSSIDSFNNDPQLPKPPTMPVITGVTLKSATVRLKSMPIQLDSRNMLLESIRNFGGREKLKSAAERY